MRAIFVLPVLLLATVPVPLLAQPKPISAVDAIHQVGQAEHDFDAYTHKHGYTQGFYKYSAPDAVDFHPQAFAIHDKLAEDLKADSSDKPSTLRWGPEWIGVAGSRDMAWDLGPWWIEGTDQAGWFFTVWQRQDDGTWLWVLDGGAGPENQTTAKAASRNSTASFNIGVSPTPETSQPEAAALDDSYNAGLAAKTAIATYNDLHWQLPDIVAGDSAAPATSQSKTADADRNAMLRTRPQGLTWTRDGEGGSWGGDMVYTYGHASAADGTFKGHYVRVWHKLAADATSWAMTADIYQSAQ